MTLCLASCSRTSVGAPGSAAAGLVGTPVVAGVTELFRWVADGDRVLVDGDVGSVTVNPSRVDVAALHRRFPEVGWLSFERWAGRQPWAAILGA